MSAKGYADLSGSGRRSQVLNAAIMILGSAGEHALSHQRIDRVARVPMGTTSNHFRTRGVLLAALCKEIEQRRITIWEKALCAEGLDTLEDLTDVLACYAAATSIDTTGLMPMLTRAHFCLGAMAQSQPGLRETLAASHHEHVRLLHRTIETIESAWQPKYSQILADYIAGCLARAASTRQGFAHLSDLGELVTALAAVSSITAPEQPLSRQEPPAEASPQVSHISQC